MFPQLSVAAVLVLFTLCLQCAGVAGLIHWLRSVVERDMHKLGIALSVAIVMQAEIGVIALQAVVISLWASCYRLLCFSSWGSAFYFSAASYSTVGYGDVLLPSKWRLLGPLEAMVGVLMCGISVGLIFALITRLVGEARHDAGKQEEQHAGHVIAWPDQSGVV